MNSEKINELIDVTKCDKHLAQLVLSFTHNDITNARKIIEAIPKDVAVLKGTFSCSKIHIFGQLILVFNMTKHEPEKVIVLAHESMDAANNDVNIPWQLFKKNMDDFRYQRGDDMRLAHAFEDMFFRGSVCSKIGRAIHSNLHYDSERLRAIFTDIVSRVVGDSSASVQVGIEFIDPFVLNRFSLPYNAEESVSEDYEVPEAVEVITEGYDTIVEKPISEPDTAVSEHAENIEREIVVLQEEALVSPVSGKAVSLLEPGDEIFVRITDTREIGRFLAQLLEGRRGEALFPIKTKVVSVNNMLETGSLVIMTEFGPGIMGRAFVPHNIKVDYVGAGQETDEDDSTVEPIENNVQAGQWWVVVLIAVFVVILITLLVIIGAKGG